MTFESVVPYHRVMSGPPQKQHEWGISMPKQITDVNKFLELKLRTSTYLYTIILEPQKAEEVLQQVKCQIVEARSSKEED